MFQINADSGIKKIYNYYNKTLCYDYYYLYFIYINRILNLFQMNLDLNTEDNQNIP